MFTVFGPGAITAFSGAVTANQALPACVVQRYSTAYEPGFRAAA
jgi:hypothetical protein